MSIKYNNKVIAGKYKEQVIPFANTIDAGIAKIATQEEINEGVDNTSIVTPVYLAKKQDKLTAGEGINIDATNIISSKILPDKVTIVENDNKTISTVARKTVNENILFDWEGTEAEYQQALRNGEIEPDWYCYITDDELAVSYSDVLSRTLINIAPDGVKVLNASNAYLTNDIYTDELGYNQLLELKNNAIKIDGVDYVTVNNVEKEIPYVLTHTGSKIVNAEHREFLTEFYNENGYTEYFTIDEENKNYTLPMGEIYGKLLNKDLSNLSETGIDAIKNITSELVSQIELKANTSLDNLNDNAKTYFDGQWTPKGLQLLSTTNDQTVEMSLADYLPVDNFAYEVMVTGLAYTGSTSGAGVVIDVGSSLVEPFVITYVRTRANGVVQSAGTTVTPIGVDRKMTISVAITTSGTGKINLTGYRRLGKSF